MTKEKEIERLRSMGIKKNVPFKLVNMNGTFVVDVEARTVTDVSYNQTGVVHGMYNNLLRGVYRREVK